MGEFNYLKGFGIFIGILAIVFLVIFFFWYIIIGIAFALCILLMVIIFILVIVAIVLLFAIPYYILTKKPEVQRSVSYKLEEVKDKDDDKEHPT